MENEADVLGVDGGCEVMEKGLTAVPPLPVKALYQIALDVFQTVRITSEVWEIFLDADRLDFLHQEVHFVQKQDDGDVEEELVVDNGLKDVHGLH